MIFRKVWCLGDNIDTDMIIAGKYLNSTDPSVLAEHCLEAVEKGWAAKISKGDMLAAGKNFGCGSSREHAPVALKSAGISCVVAESFGAIFFRNAINLGLPAIELEGVRDRLKEGDFAEVDIGSGKLRNITTGKAYDLPPTATIVIDILESGGLLPYIKKKKNLV